MDPQGILKSINVLNLKTAFVFSIAGSLTLLCAHFLKEPYLNGELETSILVIIFVIVVTTSISFAFIIIHLVIKSFNILDKKINNGKEKKEFRDKVELTLPQLREYELHFLRNLAKGNQRMDAREYNSGDFLKSFKREGWIYDLHNPEPCVYIVSINPIVRDLFLDFDKKRYEENVRKNISELDIYSKEFLEIFWQDTLIYGTEESDVLMPRDVYYAGNLLSRDEMLILKKSGLNKKDDGRNYIKFSLNEYPKKYLQTSVFDAPPVNDEIELCQDFIQGTGSSGSGAPPRSARRLAQ